MSAPDKNAAPGAAQITNFLRNIIDADLAANKFAGRGWAGVPGEARLHAAGEADPAKIRTRFPPGGVWHGHRRLLVHAFA